MPSVYIWPNISVYKCSCVNLLTHLEFDYLHLYRSEQELYSSILFAFTVRKEDNILKLNILEALPFIQLTEYVVKIAWNRFFLLQEPNSASFRKWEGSTERALTQIIKGLQNIEVKKVHSSHQLHLLIIWSGSAAFWIKIKVAVHILVVKLPMEWNFFEVYDFNRNSAVEYW